MTLQTSRVKARPLFDPPIVRRAVVDAILKLNPRHQVKNPVMFTVEVVSLLTTILWLQWVITGTGEETAGFVFAISVWLWFTVVFANFAEAMAEGRGKAQADALRKTRRDVTARKLASPKYGVKYDSINATQLRKGDVVLVEAGAHPLGMWMSLIVVQAEQRRIRAEQEKAGAEKR